MKVFSNGHWLFNEQMGDSKYVGFIYIVKDSVLNRYYLGKKLYRLMKGINKGKEGNWKKYVSSSKLLAEMFAERPLYEFEFICVEEYRTLSGLNWAETYSLVFVEAPFSKQWFNTRIEAVTWNVKEHVTDRHKEKLKMIMESLV
jgi:hypothetical protein